MTKVLIKHKDGSLNGPYELQTFKTEESYVWIPSVKQPSDGELQRDQIHSGVIEALGLEVIPYEERKVEVTKERLAQLWKEYELGAWKGDTDTSVFKRFCEDLGL